MLRKYFMPRINNSIANSNSVFEQEYNLLSPCNSCNQVDPSKCESIGLNLQSQSITINNQFILWPTSDKNKYCHIRP